MKCSRCGGFVVSEVCESDHGEVFRGFRCVHCGDAFDLRVLFVRHLTKISKDAQSFVSDVLPASEASQPERRG